VTDLVGTAGRIHTANRLLERFSVPGITIGGESRDGSYGTLI
jgi:hypothetical protein